MPITTNDKLSNFEQFMRSIPREELAGLLYSYITESNHNSWDGFSPRDQYGIGNMLADMQLYYQNTPKDIFSEPIFTGVHTY